MSAAEKMIDETAHRVGATLGDVLYADRARALVPEHDWVSLVQSIAAGDERALYELYARLHRIVFTLAVRITNDRAAAEEVTLDVFHDVWRRAAWYDAADGSVVGWIMNQARSRALHHARPARREEGIDPHLEAPLPAYAGSEPPDLCAIPELRGLLDRALRLLTADERRMIESAYFRGLTHTEIAERFNEPPGVVKTQIRSGLAKLRQALSGT